MIISSFFKKYDDNEFLYCTNTRRKLTYGEFFDLSSRVASIFAETGISSNDRIFFSTDNSIELYLAWTATIILGADIVLIDPNYSNDLINSIYKKLKPTLFITDKKKFSLCKVITPGDLSQMISLYSPYKGPSNTLSDVISFTSGTESLPKGVVRNISSYFDNAVKFSSEIGIDIPCKNILSTFSGYYLGGFYNSFIIPIVNGWKITIIPNFYPNLVVKFWSVVKENHVDTLWLVPSIINLLNTFALRNKQTQNLSSIVKHVLCGTSSLLLDSRVKFKENFGLNIMENYSLSETLFISSQRHKDRDHSVGNLMSYVDMDNNLSKISVRTPYLLTKYINLSGNDISYKKKSLFDTGDLGEIVYRKLSIIGREKDLIIRGGVNISPKYIEEILATSSIDEIAVIGAPDIISGEKIICYYVSKFNFDKELKLLSKSKLNRIFRPEKFIRLDAFPKTSSGKILKTKLKNFYK